jgi:hypothetical protein
MKIFAKFLMLILYIILLKQNNVKHELNSRNFYYTIAAIKVLGNYLLYI